MRGSLERAGRLGALPEDLNYPLPQLLLLLGHHWHYLHLVLSYLVHPTYQFLFQFIHSYYSGFLLILLLETFAGKCFGGKRRRSKKVKKKFDEEKKKKFDDDNKEEKQMPKTPDTVQMVERWMIFPVY